MGTRRRLPPPPRKPRLRTEDHTKKHSVDLCGLRCAPFRVPSFPLKADISGHLIAGHYSVSDGCPLYPRKRTCRLEIKGNSRPGTTVRLPERPPGGLSALGRSIVHRGTGRAHSPLLRCISDKPEGQMHGSSYN